MVFLLLLGSPAHAEVFGDVTVGARLDDTDVNRALGLRGGVASERIGAVVSADWRHIPGHGEDFSVDVDQFRPLAGLALRFQPGVEELLEIDIEGGVDIARLHETGFSLATRMWSSNVRYRTGAVFKTSVAFFEALDPVQFGVVVAGSASSYSGAAIDLAFVLRYAR